jgi:hypothetical protein
VVEASGDVSKDTLDLSKYSNISGAGVSIEPKE